jgi:hypothetical protein
MGFVVVRILSGFHVGWCLKIVRLGGLLEMVYVMIIWWCFLEVKVCRDCRRVPKWMVVRYCVILLMVVYMWLIRDALGEKDVVLELNLSILLQ